MFAQLTYLQYAGRGRDCPLSDYYMLLGDVPNVNRLIPDSEFAQVKPEGYIVRYGLIGNNKTLAVRGKAPSLAEYPYKLTPRNNGLFYGIYRTLEAMGMAFLHPMHTIYPNGTKMPP